MTACLAGPAGRAELVAWFRRAFQFADRVGWASYDPFDLLLSPAAGWVRSRSSVGARVLIQIGKRADGRLRALLRVAPHEEAKAIADFLCAASILVDRVGEDWAAPYVEQLGRRLERLGRPLPHGIGWGLGFPYTARFVSAPAHTPNAYTTVCCVAALAEGARIDASDRLLDLARAGAQAIRRDLGIARVGSEAWFRYWAGNDTCIVNLQALIAATLQRLGRQLNDPQMLADAALAAAVPVRAQRSDGAFPYALDKRGQFIDAFHTGFVLEGLTSYLAAGGSYDTPAVTKSVARGLGFMRRRLISDAGLPLKSPDGRVISDGQNVGQLVQTLAACGEGAELEAAHALWRQCAPHVLPALPRARSPSLRWDIGPMVAAGAHLAASTAEAR